MLTITADTLKLEWVEAPEPAEVRFGRIIRDILALKMVSPPAEIDPDSLSGRIIRDALGSSRIAVAARARLSVIGDNKIVGY